MSEETAKWGLHTVAVWCSWTSCCDIADWNGLGQSTLKFINDDASSVHGAVRASSVFTSESGEWKLGGFDILSSMKEDDAIIYVSDPRPGLSYLCHWEHLELTQDKDLW